MIQLLDKGYIKFIEKWGSDERIIESARMSVDRGFEGWYRCPDCKTPLPGPQHHTSAPGVFCLNETVVEPHDARLLAHLYRNNHSTPFEVAGLTVEVKAPIFVFREWHRHRTQSYNEMSARYVPLPNENYLPTAEDAVARSQAAATAANKQQRGATTKTLDFDTALEDLAALETAYNACQHQYERMLDHGWPKELARLPTPVARYSRMRASANLLNWLKFLTLRTAAGAQKEIRVYAEQVGFMIQECFPGTYSLWEEGAKAK